MAKTVQNLIRKTTTKPQKNSKKHVFWGLTKNTEKHLYHLADDWCWGAESEGEAIAGDGRCSTQGAAQY
jgi:hypothetical protein